MPRRKPKSAYQPGQSGNPNGRPIGSTNQINNQIRDAFAMLLQSQIPNLQDWLNRAAQRDPIKALDLFTKISERFVPSLQRVDHNIEGGIQTYIPIQINIPKLTIGEGTPTALLASPGEEVKELPESVSEGTELLGETSSSTNVTSQFTIPTFALSPNQERDFQQMREGSSTESLIPPGDGPGGL